VQASNVVLSVTLAAFSFLTAGCSLQQTVAREEVVPWPAFYGQVGPYGLRTAQEMDTMGAHNFHLALIPYQGNSGPFVDAMSRNNIHYIDSYPWWEINQVCAPQLLVKHACAFSADEEQLILANISDHLQITSEDPSIIGYWVLDDYPGDVHQLLEAIHVLIANSNSTAVVKRPAICGFGGSLDWKKRPSDLIFASNYHYFDLSLVNFSPAACDMVALYPYGINTVNDPTTIDWSMRSLLSHFLAGLAGKGWNQLQQPFIGMPQTFSYAWQNSAQAHFVTPREQDISMQAASYCKAGAVALLPYSWDDSYTGPKSELYNSPFMVRGLQQGVTDCKKYWYH
jgi:hypothetical protein